MSEALPSGPRIDVAARNYFPMTPGDMSTYDLQPSDRSAAETLSRSVSGASGGDVLLTEHRGSDSASSVYRVTAAGIVLPAPLFSNGPEGLNHLIGDLVEYPLPFFSPGTLRTLVRQGSTGNDLDGDGLNDSFRLEFAQTMVGFESLDVQGSTLTDVVHFRNQMTLMLQPSRLQNTAVTSSSIEETWWAPGLGLVKAVRSTQSGNGNQAYSLVLREARVSGKTAFAVPSDGSFIKVPLVHNALVFDAARNRYYATVPGSELLHGNSIAVIDASDGKVTYSAPIGSGPSALAISADGTSLYAGLNGAGEIVRLQLPELSEVSRTRLPEADFFGQLSAEQIAVSPVDANVVAVSMFRANVSPRHGGVALIRNGVLQPVTTQEHTGSNLVAFDPSGTFVYGLNNETTEFGLRRIGLLPDGLAEEKVVNTTGWFGTRHLDAFADGLVADRAVYRMPDMTLAGTVDAQVSGCRPHTVPHRLVCLTAPSSNSDSAALALVDSKTFVLLATPSFKLDGNGITPFDVVPGASGQAALRIPGDAVGTAGKQVWLFNSDQLR